jgi:hypothetical protein
MHKLAKSRTAKVRCHSTWAALWEKVLKERIFIQILQENWSGPVAMLFLTDLILTVQNSENI